MFSQAPQIDYETVRFTRNATAIRATEKISLDGRLEEPVWDAALPAKDFTQWSPNLGEPAVQKTEVRFVYDEQNLYVAFTCFDSEIARMIVNEMKEDFVADDTDGITLVIDSMHDSRSGFLFGVNPAGAKRDTQIVNDGQLNYDWDGVWDVKTSINGEAWIAEIAVPFKTLRFSNSPSQEWGVNLARRVRRLNETSYWSPTPLRYRATNVSQAGTLRGLEDINQGRNINVKPYVTAGVTQTRNSDQMQTLRDYDGGVDGKFGLTQSLTLDTTYRTDFAQVEVDQQQVNLTRFNLFFPEKRDFFLENSGTFSFGPGGNLVPFFSRRIGLSPAGVPIPIIGGARVTGKVGQYDLGFLAMKTEKLDATPSNNYLVGRLKRNLMRRSWVGALVTSRDSTLNGDYNRVYGADAHLEFNRLEFDSYLLKSATPGQPEMDQARRLQAGWRADELTITAEYNQVQVNFNPDIGFIRRRNNTQYATDFAWNPLLESNATIRNLTFGASADYFQGGNGTVETRTQTVSLGMQFENASSITFTNGLTFDRLLNTTRIQGIPIAAGDYKYLDHSARFNTNGSKRISGSGNVTWGEFWNGRRLSTGGNVTLKPNYRLNITFNYSRDRLRLPDGSATTNLAGARFIYGFSPRSFVNAFFQYNGATHEVSTNIRFNITYRPLSDLYLVYNDRRNTSTSQLMERAFIVKLTNLFTF